jgi:hypothetical protein
MSEDSSLRTTERVSIADSVVKTRRTVPDGYVSFKGYLDEAQDGVHRVYLDDSFWCWIEVQADDIAHRMDVPNNPQDPRSIVWIKRSALVTRSEVGSASDIAHSVWGDDDHAAVIQRRPRPPY